MTQQQSPHPAVHDPAAVSAPCLGSCMLRTACTEQPVAVCTPAPIPHAHAVMPPCPLQDLVLEEVSNLANRLRSQALEGRGETLELAKQVNDFQACGIHMHGTCYMHMRGTCCYAVDDLSPGQGARGTEHGAWGMGHGHARTRTRVDACTCTCSIYLHIYKCICSVVSRRRRGA